MSAPPAGFAGTWAGTYTFAFHNYPCGGIGCMADSPAYCGPGLPNPCQPGAPTEGACPDFTLSGRARLTISQTGSQLRGRITFVGAGFHMGPQCTNSGRSTVGTTLSGATSGRVASAKIWQLAGNVTLTGKSLNGTLTGTYKELVETVTLHLKPA